VRFLVDAQLSHKLSAWLITQSHEAQAVREVGLQDADDGAI
jgi:predicted nuclease of predicted toxin-antitoxin system